MGMHARSSPWAQAGLSACALAAALTYGAQWIGMGWAYDITVNSHRFQLGPEFGLGILAAVLMGAAAGPARASGKPAGITGLTIGSLAILASSLWILLVWAPSGDSDGQLKLLQDASRLGFAVMALSLPLALPGSVQPLARAAALALGVVLAPVILFPDHVEAAGLKDVHTTLPMLLFFAQGALSLSGVQGRSSGRRRSSGSAEAESGRGLWMRAGLSKTAAKARKAAPALRFEALRSSEPPDRPAGPDGPEHPLPPLLRVERWFNQF